MANLPTSQTLLERLRERDQEAWKRLDYLYSPLVRNWYRDWGVPAADIEDLTQEALQAVSSGLGTFRRDRPGDSFRGWLRVISRHKFLDHARRMSGQPRAAGGSVAQQRLLEVPADADPNPTETLQEAKGIYRRALELVRSQFEDKSWQAFWRCAVDGQAPADVAKEMQMSAAAVRQAKSRILRRLKDEFGELLA